MVKKGILIVALVALILGALFLLVSCDVGVPLKIDADDNGREVTLQVGQALVLTLESNPTTGYSWDPPEFDEAVLKQTNHEYEPYERPLGKVGTGGEETWYFKAQSPGTTTLHLEYARSWEEGVEPAKAFTVQVTVQPASLLLRLLGRFVEAQTPADPVLVINYQRSGGFAGVDERWLIYDNGLVEGRDLTTGDRGRAWTGNVGAQAVADLLKLIEKEDFFSFEERYGPLNACCDRFTHRIAVRRPHPRCPDPAALWKVVIVTDGADAPEGLGRIMGELNNLVSSVDTPDSNCVGEMEELKPGQQCCPGLQPQTTKLGKVLCVPPGVLVD